jgi:hypothetical protein
MLCEWWQTVQVGAPCRWGASRRDERLPYALVELVEHAGVADAAGRADVLVVDPGLRVGVRQDVVGAVAVVADRRDHEAGAQQRAAVDADLYFW